MEGLIFITIIGILIYLRINRGITIKKYRKEYYDAIDSGNRQLALNLGRRYRAKTRSGFWGQGGRCTTYDENAITNDLSVMDKRS
ncbi:MAG: hypothetical protein K2Q22_09610 [Cytophagales bacterium]|nr:hypothetical protein [Cytophagales bacterium]